MRFPESSGSVMIPVTAFCIITAAALNKT